MKGKFPCIQAVEKSLNVPAVWLLNEIGVEKGIDAVKRFGLPTQEADEYLPLALGGTRTGYSPKQMAEAYGVFANGGERVESHIITKIVGPTDKIEGEAKPKRYRVTDRKTAEQMTAMLLNVVETGTARNAKLSDRPMAGKTGSTSLAIQGITDGTKDQWLVGYTPDIVGAVWLGYDITDENHYLKGSSGSTVAPILKSIMEGATPYIENTSFDTTSINQRLEEQKQKEQKSIKERMNKFDEKMLKEMEKWKEKLEKGKGNLKKFEEKLKDTYRKYRGE